jgi:hypothetical protein
LYDAVSRLAAARWQVGERKPTVLANGSECAIDRRPERGIPAWLRVSRRHDGRRVRIV